MRKNERGTCLLYIRPIVIKKIRIEESDKGRPKKATKQWRSKAADSEHHNNGCNLYAMSWQVHE